MGHIIVNYLYPVIGSIFILFSIFYCIGQLGTDVTIHKVKRQLIIWAYIAFTIGVSFLGNGLINLLLLLLVPLLGHMLYNRNRAYLMYYLSLIIGLYLTDILASVGFNLLFQKQYMYFSSQQNYIVVLILGTRLIEYAVLRLLTVIIRNKQHRNITLKQLLFSLLLPVFSIFNLLSMIILLDVFPSEEHQLLLTLNTILLILLNLYFTVIIDTMGRNNQLQSELKLYQQQQTIQARYYENLEQKYDNTRKLVHDIRNHIQAIERLSDNEAAAESREYVQDIHGMLNQLSQKYYTNNKMLNIILNDKVQQMNALGIQEDIKIADAALDFLRNIDITTLFSNLLDNAIEASSSSAQKTIALRIATVHDLISITVRNSADHPPRKEGLFFQSTKEKHEGLGLRNVERVIKQYQGDIQYQWKDSYFITRIMFAG